MSRISLPVAMAAPYDTTTPRRVWNPGQQVQTTATTRLRTGGAEHEMDQERRDRRGRDGRRDGRPAGTRRTPARRRGRRPRAQLARRDDLPRAHRHRARGPAAPAAGVRGEPRPRGGTTVKALLWKGVNELSVEEVPDPRIINEQDAIVKVTRTVTCGSDLHLIGGYIPFMQKGDVLGHEFLGEIVEVGPQVRRHAVGDRVVVCSFVSCGRCWYCAQGLYSACDNGNTNPAITEELWGYAPGGVFGYSHAMGGFAGSHAQYIRVPYADHGAFRVPDEVADERALFASDSAPTGWMGAETLNYEQTDIGGELRERTGGRGPDVCIEAVGMEAHSAGPQYLYDQVKQQLRLETDRPAAVREAIYHCRKGGSVFVLGVFGGLVDKFPLGALMNKGLTLRSAQMHGHRYIPMLLDRMARGELVTEHLATHTMPLDDGPQGYKMFKEKLDGCVRSVFLPN